MMLTLLSMAMFFAMLFATLNAIRVEAREDIRQVKNRKFVN